MNPNRIFVAGATGYTGQNVVSQLRDRDLQTVAHIRPDSSRLADWIDRFGDMGAQTSDAAWTEAAMTQAIADFAPTHVYCLIGTTKSRKNKASDKEAETYEAVDYGLTSLLIRACVASGVNPRFIYLSSLGVSASTPSSYLQARYKAETELIASGLDHVIARPSFISGDDREESRPSERIGATLADGALGLMGALGMRSVKDRYSSLTGAELAAGLIGVGLSSRSGVVDTVGLRSSR